MVPDYYCECDITPTHTITYSHGYELTGDDYYRSHHSVVITVSSGLFRRPTELLKLEKDCDSYESADDILPVDFDYVEVLSERELFKIFRIRSPPELTFNL